jgi:diketogulonate reductase-like aldo/keto reductase
MKAMLIRHYGGPQVFEAGETPPPRPGRGERIRENGALFDFELSTEEMSSLDALEEGLVTGWDPRSAP